jgi:flagellar motor switch protein FliG
MTNPDSRDQSTIRCDALYKAISLMMQDHATDSGIAEILRPEPPEIMARVLMRLAPDVYEAVKSLLNEKSSQG